MDNKLTKKQRKLAKAESKRREQEEEASIQKQQQHQKESGKDKNHNSHSTNERKKEGDSSKNKKQNKQLVQKKTKKIEKNEESQDEKNEEQNNDQNLDFNQVLEGEQNLEFAFLIAEITEKHYHSMKTILEKFARITGIISSDWADSIIANGKAGNVVGTDDADDEQQQEEQEDDELEEEDENVCSGVINILPSTNKLVKKVVNKIQQAIRSKQPKYHGSVKPSDALNNTCSLLVCERAVNLPAVIAKSMHEVLAQDLKQMQMSEKKEYDKICSGHILGVSEVELPKGSNRQHVTADELIYTKFEDFLFLNNSESWWVGEGSPNAVRKVPLHKLYFVIRTDKYFEAVGAIDGLLCEDGAGDS